MGLPSFLATSLHKVVRESGFQCQKWYCFAPELNKGNTNKKLPPLVGDGSRLCFGSWELTAEVVEQDVL